MGNVTDEAVSFKSGDLTLEGMMHFPSSSPSAGVAVCHPHPLYGGDMDNNVVMEVCRSLTDGGIAALRFNFRGTGKSEGTFDDGEGEQEDVRAALNYLRSLDVIDKSRIGLAGYSFGGLVAAEVASGELRALGLISPPLSVSDLKLAWGCPALIVTGDMDQLSPVERVEVVGEAPGIEVFVIEGADHSWWGCEAELGEVIGRFFAQHLRKTAN
jgi:alpha/beta superfamily hydrolase